MILIFSFLIISLVTSVKYTHGESPTIVRQQFTDGANDLSVDCGTARYNISSSDIVSEYSTDLGPISFSSDGKYINSSFWPGENNTYTAFSGNKLNGTVKFSNQILMNVIELDTNTFSKNTSKILRTLIENMTRLYSNKSIDSLDNYSDNSKGNSSYFELTYSYKDLLGTEHRIVTYWFSVGDMLYIVKFSASSHFFNKFMENVVGSGSNSSDFANRLFANFFNITELNINQYNERDLHKHIMDNIQSHSLVLHENKTQNDPSQGKERFVNDIFPQSKTIFSTFYPVEFKIEAVEFVMLVDIKSNYDKGPDYFTAIYLSSEEKKPIEESYEVVGTKDNFNFLNKIRLTQVPYHQTSNQTIPLSFDLDLANSPHQYNLLFLSTLITDPANYYMEGDNCVISDASSWVAVPPPDFALNLTKNPVEVRADELENLQLELYSNSSLDLMASVYNGSSPNANAYFQPKVNIFLPSFGKFSIDMQVLGKEDNKTKMGKTISSSIPITVRTSFPKSSFTVEYFYSSRPNVISSDIEETMEKHIDLTVITKPKLNEWEKFRLWTDSWVSTVTGLWSFLAGVAAVTTPLIYRIIQKRKKKKEGIWDQYE